MKKIRVTRLMGLVLIMIANTVFAEVSIISVGTDGDCDNATIQEAIDSVVMDSDFIIHVTNEVYKESLLIDKGNVIGTIKGGFENCAEAEANQATSNKTTVSGDTTNNGTGDSRVMAIMSGTLI